MMASTLFDVSGQVAVVTGAASGLGLAMTGVMAANGARVLMTDIDGVSLEREAAALLASGLQVETQVVDTGTRGQVTASIDAMAERYGQVDAVFANAAISSGPGFGNPEGQIEAVSPDLWDRAIQVNLTGVFETVQAASRPMKRQRSGSIIVTSSVAALRPSPLPGHAYHATKAAVATLVRVVAMELGSYGVRINAIAPGPFITNIAGGRLRDPEERKRYLSNVPLGRAAEPPEIMGLALFLASSASSYVTGTLIPIDGGTAA